MANQPQQGDKVRIRLMRGPNLFMQEINGKVYGGVVYYKGATLHDPVIYFGDADYSTYDAKRKLNILELDTLNNSLLSKNQKAIDMNALMTRVSHSLIKAAETAKDNMGIREVQNDMLKWAAFVLVGFFIVILVFFYLITHQYAPAASTSSGPTTPFGVNVVTVGATLLMPKLEKSKRWTHG